MGRKYLRKLVPLLSAVGLLAAGNMPAHAAFVQVPLSSDNAKLQDLTNGNNYPVSGALTVGGVPFTIAVDANGNNMWTTFLNGTVLDIPVNVFGVSTGYTLMNSIFGSCGATIGTVEFQGSGGADQTFALIEGINIRDHIVGAFCNNIAPGTPSMDFGGDVHLDRQTFALSSAFLSQTLTHVVLTGFHLGGLGEPFITSLTVNNGVTSVPEPGTLILLGVGLAVFASVGRRKRYRLKG